MQVPGDVADVKQAAGDGNRGERAVQALIGPDLARVRDVAALRGIDALQGAPAAAVLRIAADGYVNAGESKLAGTNYG